MYKGQRIVVAVLILFQPDDVHRGKQAGDPASTVGSACSLPGSANAQLAFGFALWAHAPLDHRAAFADQLAASFHQAAAALDQLVRRRHQIRGLHGDFQKGNLQPRQTFYVAM